MYFVNVIMLQTLDLPVGTIINMIMPNICFFVIYFKCSIFMFFLRQVLHKIDNVVNKNGHLDFVSFFWLQTILINQSGVVYIYKKRCYF